MKYLFPFQNRVEKMQGSYKRSKGNQANSQCIPVYNLAYFKPMNVFTSSDVVDIICSQCQSGELQSKWWIDNTEPEEQDLKLNWNRLVTITIEHLWLRIGHRKLHRWISALGDLQWKCIIYRTIFEKLDLGHLTLHSHWHCTGCQIRDVLAKFLYHGI